MSPDSDFFLPSDDSIQSEFLADYTMPIVFICHTWSNNNEWVSVRVCCDQDELKVW